MRKIQVLVLSVLCLFSLAVPASANPPQDIRLNWENVGEILNVWVLHRSDNPKRHFIDSIRVMADNRQIASVIYKGQPEPGGTQARFVLHHLPKDAIITVIAHCNQGGVMKRNINVPHGAPGNQPGQPGQPGQPRATLGNITQMNV